jgi:hypothetical protein
MNNPDSLQMISTRPKIKRRANEIFQETFDEYNLTVARLKREKQTEEMTVNLFCIIGGKHYDVFQVSAKDDIFTMSARDNHGDIHKLIVPVEQVAFDILISKKTKEVEGWGVKFMGFEVPETKK